MRRALIYRKLQGIVVREAVVIQFADIGQERIFRAVRTRCADNAGSDFLCGIGCALSVKRRAGEAGPNRTGVPAGAKRGLVNINVIVLIAAVSADVGNVDGQIIRNGALHVKVPRHQVALA